MLPLFRYYLHVNYLLPLLIVAFSYLCSAILPLFCPDVASVLLYYRFVVFMSPLCYLYSSMLSLYCWYVASVTSVPVYHLHAAFMLPLVTTMLPFCHLFGALLCYLHVYIHAWSRLLVLLSMPVLGWAVLVVLAVCGLYRSLLPYHPEISLYSCSRTYILAF